MRIIPKGKYRVSSCGIVIISMLDKKKLFFWARYIKVTEVNAAMLLSTIYSSRHNIS